MLFNLSLQRHFPSKQTGREIFCRFDHGICFKGGEESELSAIDEPFNGEKNCKSTANKSGFGITFDESGKNMLTNMKDGRFTISELEVWEVKFI